MPTRSYRFDTSDATNGAGAFTIKDPANGRLIWTKTRALTEDEIVSTISDSQQTPRSTLHRPRQAVIASTSKRSPPWPQYLVIRSPSFPEGQYVPLIDSKPAESMDKSTTPTSAEDEGLEFNLVIPVRRVKSARPAHLDLASHSSVSLNGVSNEDENDPATPTKANPYPSPTKKKPRPKSVNYRVDMTPSLSQDSATSSTSAASSVSAATEWSFTSQDPLSTLTASDPPPVPPPSDSSRSGTFRLQAALPAILVADRAPKSVARRMLDRVRSIVVEDAKRWSCVWTRDSTCDTIQDDTSPEERVVMYFEEDAPSLFPSPLRGTLCLSTEVVDEVGYEPSFWIAVATAWIECQDERAGWREGRGGD